MRTINEIIIHCSDSDFGNAVTIDEWHRKRQFSKIGYHFVILNGCYFNSKLYDTFFDGLVETGRPLIDEGAHCFGHNDNSIGICLIGKHEFTKRQFDSLICLINYLKKKFKIEKISGHYQYDDRKTCPNFKISAITDFLDKQIRNEEWKKTFIK